MRDINRRKLFKLTAAAGVVGLASNKVLANVCSTPTAPQGLGPFFPRDNTPIDLTIDDFNGDGTNISEKNNNDLTVVNGRSGVAKGEQIELIGKVVTRDCLPVMGAKVIIWQASKTGRYNHLGDRANLNFVHPRTGEIVQRSHDENFQYWGIDSTDAYGDYSFKTIIPGFYPADLRQGWYRPPHIHFKVILPSGQEFVTQAYFRGEIEDNDFIQELNDQDFLLQSGSITNEQREKLIIKVTKNSARNILLGTFNIQFN